MVIFFNENRENKMSIEEEKMRIYTNNYLIINGNLNFLYTKILRIARFNIDIAKEIVHYLLPDIKNKILHISEDIKTSNKIWSFSSVPNKAVGIFIPATCKMFNLRFYLGIAEIFHFSTLESEKFGHIIYNNIPYHFIHIPIISYNKYQPNFSIEGLDNVDKIMVQYFN